MQKPRPCTSSWVGPSAGPLSHSEQSGRLVGRCPRSPQPVASRARVCGPHATFRLSPSSRGHHSAPSKPNPAQSPPRVLGGARHPVSWPALGVPMHWPGRPSVPDVSHACLVPCILLSDPGSAPRHPVRQPAQARGPHCRPCSFRVLFTVPRGSRMCVPKGRKPRVLLVTGSESQGRLLTCSVVSGHLCNKHMALPFLVPDDVAAPVLPSHGDAVFTNTPFMVLYFKMPRAFLHCQTRLSISDAE